jgi:hypothetical protein
MVTSKSAGTAVMGFNGKMNIVVDGLIKTKERKETAALVARGAMTDALQANGWTLDDLAAGTETHQWLKQRVTLHKFNPAGLNRYLTKKADMTAEQWKDRAGEQSQVSTAIRDYRTLLSARLIRAEAEANGEDPNEALRKAKEDKANGKKSPAERLAAMLDSAKKLIDSPDNKFPSGFNRQAHTDRLNKILANLGNIEPKH